MSPVSAGGGVTRVRWRCKWKFQTMRSSVSLGPRSLPHMTLAASALISLSERGCWMHVTSFLPGCCIDSFAYAGTIACWSLSCVGFERHPAHAEVSLFFPKRCVLSTIEILWWLRMLSSCSLFCRKSRCTQQKVCSLTLPYSGRRGWLEEIRHVGP